MYIYIYMHIYVLILCHVHRGLAGCRSFPPSPPVKTRHTHWLWFADAI